MLPEEEKRKEEKESFFSRREQQQSPYRLKTDTRIQDIKASKNIKKIITNHRRRLQKLKELQALKGLDTPPDVLLEIEDIEAAIPELEGELNLIENRVQQDATESEQLVQIFLRGDFTSVSIDIQSRAVAAFAAVMGISPEEIGVEHIHQGSVVFYLRVSRGAVNRLRYHLTKVNSPQLHLLKVERVMLERELGEVEGWFSENKKFYYLHSPQGSRVIDLLNSGLDIDLELTENIQTLYKDAEKVLLSNPEKALTLCQTALDEMKEEDLYSNHSDIIRYSRGKVQVLIASIYLNGERDLKRAENHYLESKDEFGSRRWLQLESLAYLGLAISQRKLEKFNEAYDATEIALSNIDQGIVPESIDKAAFEALRRVISNEASVIRKLQEQSTKKNEKQLLVFNISTGVKFRNRTRPKILSLNEYQKHALGEVAIIDNTKYPGIENADYILAIDENVNEVDEEIAKGDWLLIQEKDEADELNNATVAVLVTNYDEPNSEIFASLKTFFQAEDHYFLEAKSAGAKSIVVAHYKSNLSKIYNYYQSDKRIEVKRAYDVRVTGVVIANFPQNSIEDKLKSYIWRIPIVNSVSFGADIITDEYVESYRYLRDDKPKYVDFGVRITKNIITGFDIFPEDIALVRQQPTVGNGDIAAILIQTPEMEEPLGMLKYYNVIYEKQARLHHWVLVSGDPPSEFQVVMPSGVDEEAIENLYEKQKLRGKIRTPIVYYKNAEIAIIGKYVGVINQEQTGKPFTLQLDRLSPKPIEITVYQPSPPK